MYGDFPTHTSRVYKHASDSCLGGHVVTLVGYAELRPIGAATVLTQNAPMRRTRDDVIRAFKPGGSYNLVSYPYSIKQRRSCGYCFINFVAPDFGWR